MYYICVHKNNKTQNHEQGKGEEYEQTRSGYTKSTL